MGRGGSQHKRRTGSRRGGSRTRTQTSPPLPSQTKPEETPPDDPVLQSTAVTGEPAQGEQNASPQEEPHQRTTNDVKNENDVSSHDAKTEKGEEGAQEEERDEEDVEGEQGTLQHRANEEEGGPARDDRSAGEEEAVPEWGEGEEEPTTPGLPHPSAPAEEHHARHMKEKEEDEDRPKEIEERRDQEADAMDHGEERTEGQQSTAAAPLSSSATTAAGDDDGDEDGGITPIAEPMAEQAITEVQIGHADSVLTEPSTTEASDDNKAEDADASQRPREESSNGEDSALAPSPPAGRAHASDEPQPKEEKEGADQVQSTEPNASTENQKSAADANASEIGETKAVDASHQQKQPQRSKEELVESLLQVMEDIVAHRTRHPEGSRSRREHHGGPLPPLPSPCSDKAATPEQKDYQTDDAKNVATTVSLEQEAATAEVTKAGPIAERLASVLATDEAAGNGETRKRAALMVNRRPRGPLPPTPAQKSKPLPPPPAVVPDQTTDTGSKLPAAESGTSLPRSYNEDGSVKTFADTITDKSIMEELSGTEQKRQNVITEMVNTEKQYVNDLLTLIEIYINPIQEKKILEKKQMTAVFANIDTIYEINSRILKELEERQAQETVVKRIGDLFVREADKFKVYAAYCSSQDPRAKKVKKYQQRIPEFKAFCEQAFMLPRCRLLELDSFLIAPLQRVCKYPLLLKETLKNTPEDHVDHNDLKTALGKVSEIVDRINERTRVVKHVMDLKAIQKKIVSDQAQPLSLVERDRRPVREGPLVGLRYQNQKKEKDCKGAAYYAFLLNDLLLLCQPAKESKESRREKGSHGSNSHQQQMYMIKEKIDTESVAARRVLKADENSAINSPSISHRKQAKEKLTSLFGGSGSSHSASPLLASGLSEGATPVSPQACVPNQFELILNRKNVVKIYRFQTPAKIDTDLWLRDIELAHTERLLNLERQRQQDEEDLHALNAAAAASSPTPRGSIGRVSSMGSPFANGSASDSSNRSLAHVFPQRASSTSHVPTRNREGDELTDATDTSPSSTPRQEDGSASPESPVPDSQADQEGKATPRAFFQQHRRKRSTANEVFVSSPVMPTSPSSTATGQAALSAVTSALAASQAEVKELKLKLQEAERKLRVAELRISDLTTDNAELKKRLSVHERTSSSGSLPIIASSTSEGNLNTLTSSGGSRESSPRNSGTAPPQTSGNSKGHVVKRLIPGRRGGNN